MDTPLKRHHPNLSQGRWQAMSLAEQMANIGSEVSRALTWREKGNLSMSGKALERALELIDLTSSVRLGLGRQKEIRRVRETLVDYFLYENRYYSSPKDFRQYFDSFALWLANHKRTIGPIT
jgi:hypothetical protein